MSQTDTAVLSFNGTAHRYFTPDELRLIGRLMLAGVHSPEMEGVVNHRQFHSLFSPVMSMADEVESFHPELLAEKSDSNHVTITPWYIPNDQEDYVKFDSADYVTYRGNEAHKVRPFAVNTWINLRPKLQQQWLDAAKIISAGIGFLVVWSPAAGHEIVAVDSCKEGLFVKYLGDNPIPNNAGVVKCVIDRSGPRSLSAVLDLDKGTLYCSAPTDSAVVGCIVNLIVDTTGTNYVQS